MMLLYNTKTDLDLTLKIEEVPNDWVITTDRRFLQEADVVVFHIPNLQYVLENDLDKPDKQIWVAWYMEAEKNYPELKDPEINDLFDIWMSYKEDADIVYPFYSYDYQNFFTSPLLRKPQLNKTLIIFSYSFYEKIQKEYVEKLMECIEYDPLYVDLYQTNPIQPNNRLEKLTIYRDYKFIISFENVIDADYVTEKFFDPLLAGAVPIYMGAPNIEDFAPGDNCFVDVRQFENPLSLADFIKRCYEDEQLYAKFFEWRKKPLRQSFIEKLEAQIEHPLVRLCRKVDEMKK